MSTHLKKRPGKATVPKTESESVFVSERVDNSRRFTYARCCSGASLLLLLLLFIVWLLPNPIDPIEFEYSSEECPSFTGPLCVNDYLKNGRRLFENEIVGPEAFAVDKNGDIYSGLADGRIIRIDRSLKAYHNVTRTGQPPFKSCEVETQTDAVEKKCGRPLGMQFHPSNADELYVTDSSYGLLKVNVRTGAIDNLVANEATSPVMKFPNDLVLLENGSVFFTDSSKKFSRVNNLMEVLEGRGNGQLFHYDPIGRSVNVVLDGLFFPNGVSLSNDGQSLLIVETTRARILQFHLEGEKAGKTDVFSENLPGLPDNVSPSFGGDGYFVGFATTRESKVLDYFAKLPTWRSIVAKLHLGSLIEMAMPQHGLILKLNNHGGIIKSYHDVGGTVTSKTSCILDLGDQLVIGSYVAPFIVALSV